jgi:hypothetical protein
VSLCVFRAPHLLIQLKNEKHIFLFYWAAFGFAHQSQEIKDALRYSQDNITQEQHGLRSHEWRLAR